MNITEQPILSLLEQQHAQLDALLLLLKHELTILSSRDIEALTAITTEKSQLLSHIHALDAQLAHETELSACMKAPWFTEQVARLDELLNQCKQQTDINQQVLEQSQLTLERLKLEILGTRGQSGLTYTNKGKPAVESKGSGIKA